MLGKIASGDEVPLLRRRQERQHRPPIHSRRPEQNQPIHRPPQNRRRLGGTRDDGAMAHLINTLADNLNDTCGVVIQ